MPGSQDEAVDEVIFTWTLIRNPNITSSAPVTTVFESEIELSQSNVS